MTHPLFCRTSLSIAALDMLAFPATQAAAQALFPSGAVRLVVPFSASTPPDIVSRVIAKELMEGEVWRVIVENRPGGITTIAAADVLSQLADGHSLYAMSTPSVAAPSHLSTVATRQMISGRWVVDATSNRRQIADHPVEWFEARSPWNPRDRIE
jgi:tripartite-type tricarboxylate transporter receptor subunit TctC